jgi:hypothetical protein
VAPHNPEAAYRRFVKETESSGINSHSSYPFSPLHVFYAACSVRLTSYLSDILLDPEDGSSTFL